MKSNFDETKVANCTAVRHKISTKIRRKSHKKGQLFRLACVFY
jgi:hypothetical protein